MKKSVKKVVDKDMERILNKWAFTFRRKEKLAAMGTEERRALYCRLKAE